MSGPGYGRHSVAMLPMYDFPEVRAHTAAWYEAIRRHCTRLGLTHAPPRLTDSDLCFEVFERGTQEAFFLTQTCGLPLISAERRQFRVVAVPEYAAGGCEGHCYSSAVVVRDAARFQAIGDLRGVMLAHNSRHSCSGTLLLAAALGEAFHSCSELLTGGHEFSLQAVAEGRADAAAIDCVTLELLRRHRPEAVAGVRVLGYTPSAPALPYVVPLGTPDEAVAALQAALAAAVADPAPEVVAAREALLVRGMHMSAGSSDAPTLESYEEHLLPLRRSVPRPPPGEGSGALDASDVQSDVGFAEEILEHIRGVAALEAQGPRWRTLRDGRRRARVLMPGGVAAVRAALGAETATHAVAFVAFMGSTPREGSLPEDFHEVVDRIQEHDRQLLAAMDPQAVLCHCTAERFAGGDWGNLVLLTGADVADAAALQRSQPVHDSAKALSAKFYSTVRLHRCTVDPRAGEQQGRVVVHRTLHLVYRLGALVSRTVHPTPLEGGGGGGGETTSQEVPAS